VQAASDDDADVALVHAGLAQLVEDDLDRDRKAHPVVDRNGDRARGANLVG
jgi:hypothetical protein